MVIVQVPPTDAPLIDFVMEEIQKTEARALCLIIRVGSQLCALPVEHVAETMRPQSVRAIAGAPSFVHGTAVIRGLPVPVVDAASILGDGTSSSHATRFVSLKTADRHIALAVDQVVGVTQVDRTSLSDLPPLLAAANEHAVSAIGILDGELFIMLSSGKLVPEDVWTAIETAGR